MSLRSNEERLGAPPADAPVALIEEGEATPTQNNAGIGLSFVTPTEPIELPSKGRFYPPEHPLHNQETIEIKHMTAREEEILTSQSLLKKGIAIEKLLQSVIVDKKIKVGDLLVGDKNAILVYTRILAYGQEYKTKITCPGCNETDDFEFGLLDHTVTCPEADAEEYDMLEDGTFTIPLPKTQVSAQVRLMTGADEIHFSRQLEANKKKRKKLGIDFADTILTDQMKRFVVSLGGISDKVQINNFINNMPASDARHLRTVYSKLIPNIDLTQQFECSSCGHEQEMEVPFTSEFFWPR
jgi:transcription elongation factor Elf1